ncbi:MAG: 5-formyltetrahydrofolate cyclo-ligase [Eubacteriales bacterium]|nr:5-formyltetrahydrofolate cyclo-ligase [Eubacteriales bacterium]
MSVKDNLRRELKQKRKAVEEKDQKDKAICNLLQSLEPYNNADLILFYAALSDEINTDFAIENALRCGKKVALPVCTDKNGSMCFYYIRSLADVKTGYFGIREPDVNICKKVTDFSNSVCIVPAISFDRRGYRLGYGKGYYDRFLQNYTSLSVGLCYNELITDLLPNDKYDISVNYIISEDGIISV